MFANIGYNEGACAPMTEGASARPRPPRRHLLGGQWGVFSGLAGCCQQQYQGCDRNSQHNWSPWFQPSLIGVIPRRFATCMPQARRDDRFRLRVSRRGRVRGTPGPFAGVPAKGAPDSRRHPSRPRADDAAGCPEDRKAGRQIFGIAARPGTWARRSAREGSIKSRGGAESVRDKERLAPSSLNPPSTPANNRQRIIPSIGPSDSPAEPSDACPLIVDRRQPPSTGIRRGR